MYLARAHRHNMVETSLNDLFLKRGFAFTLSAELSSVSLSTDSR